MHSIGVQRSLEHHSANSSLREGDLKPNCLPREFLMVEEKDLRVEQAYFLPLSKPIVLKNGVERERKSVLLCIAEN